MRDDMRESHTVGITENKDTKAKKTRQQTTKRE